MEGNYFDLTRFNPEHFRHIEWCVKQLQSLGIEADLIVMHPYDRWGFSCMTREQDHLYWKYVLARFAAYRNVWWSLANEYDLFEHKTVEDWKGYARLICERDPFHYLRSIHNCIVFYDHTRPWITHCSIQRQDLYKFSELTGEWRTRYHSRLCWMRSLTREISSTDGETSAGKRWCAASGRQPAAADIRDMARPI